MVCSAGVDCDADCGCEFAGDAGFLLLEGSLVSRLLIGGVLKCGLWVDHIANEMNLSA